MGASVSRGEVFKQALFNQYNVILLVAGAVFAVAFASIWPAILVLVLECLWLGVGAQTDWFRHWVQVQHEKAHQSRREALGVELSRDLEPPYATRVQILCGLADQIRHHGRERGMGPEIFANMEGSAGAALGGERDRFDVLIASFAKMAALHQRLSRFVAEASPTSLEEEIVRLGQSLGDEKDPAVRLSLRQALTVGQRRLKQHEQIESQRRALGVKMGTLEMSFDYVRSCVLSGNPVQELAAELQELIASASFLSAAEAEANASLARLSGSSVVTRTLTTPAIGE